MHGGPPAARQGRCGSPQGLMSVFSQQVISAALPRALSTSFPRAASRTTPQSVTKVRKINESQRKKKSFLVGRNCPYSSACGPVADGQHAVFDGVRLRGGRLPLHYPHGHRQGIAKAVCTDPSRATEQADGVRCRVAAHWQRGVAAKHGAAATKHLFMLGKDSHITQYSSVGTDIIYPSRNFHTYLHTDLIRGV